jgi:O-antigen/teichoic acid export membrane protein
MEAVFLARDDFTWANIINSGLGVARALTALIACWIFEVNDLRYWAFWYAALHTILCLVCAVMIRRVGTPRWRLMQAELPLGISLSLSGFLHMLRSNVDILVLTAISTPQFIGVYGVARRIVAFGLMVPGAFYRLVYGRLAVAGTGGPAATLRLARKYLVISAAISATTSAIIFIVAGLVPRLVGVDYADAVGIVQILCWTLISTAVQFLAFDSLNAAELHRVSAAISGTTNLVGAATVIWLGSAYGVIGIFASLYLSDIIRGAAMWLALELISRRRAVPMA